MSHSETTVFIIHGFYGHPSETWIPWVKKRIEVLGCPVIVPTFPAPENQTLEHWLETFESYKVHLNERSIIIAHSLGASFTLQMLQNTGLPIKSTLLVAGFVGHVDIGFVDKTVASFTTQPLDWHRLSELTGRCHVFASDNDPYVPLEKGNYLAEKLHAQLHIIPGAGHFSQGVDPKVFNQVVEAVKTELAR